MADAIVSSGMRRAGYRYVIVDDASVARLSARSVSIPRVIARFSLHGLGGLVTKA